MHETKLDATTACEALINCIKLLKVKYPRYSSKQIARLLNIPNSTFGRIENSETTTPKFVHALKIIQSVCEEGDVYNFINKHYPQMSKFFEKVYSGNSKVKFAPVNSEQYFSDSSTYKIMLLVTSGIFVTSNLIKDEFGNDGLKIVDDLICNNILKKQDDEILLMNETLNLGQDTAQKLLQNLVTFNYDIDKFGTSSNWLSVQYKAIDKNKVLGKLIEIAKEANQKHREVLNDPSNAGNDVVWVGMAIDTLFEDRPELVEKEVLQ